MNEFVIAETIDAARPGNTHSERRVLAEYSRAVAHQVEAIYMARQLEAKLPLNLRNAAIAIREDLLRRDPVTVVGEMAAQPVAEVARSDGGYYNGVDVNDPEVQAAARRRVVV